MSSRGFIVLILPVLLAVGALYVYTAPETMPPLPPPGPGGLYPGDSIIPDAVMMYDQTKLIHALPSDVWPWVQQVGKGRGGMSPWRRVAPIRAHSHPT